MGRIMKKSLLLSFCLLCISGVTACSNTRNSNEENIPYIEEDITVIDTTLPSQQRCGVNGISCNDSALVNYTKTEADYRQYGERTKRDHLYTQAGVGNNVSATIRPDIENDVVKANARGNYSTPKQPNAPIVEEDVFSETSSLILDTPRKPLRGEIGKADNVITPTEEKVKEIITKKKTIIKTVTEEDGASYEIECTTPTCTEVQKIKQIVKTAQADGTQEEQYEIVCEDDCDEFLAQNDRLDIDFDDDTITSEFTEESFDLADLAEEDAELGIEFEDVGPKDQLVADLDIEEVKIADETVLTWEAEEGDNLRELLTKWSAMSGWKLLWNTNRNYVLSAGVMFKGKFADVSSALIRAFARARPAPIATYYKGNRVIVVETLENENAY